MSAPILKVENLNVSFPIKGGGEVKAVQDVSFEISRGEIVGLVGESGCGKSTLARSITRLIKPKSGNIFFKGNNLVSLKSSDLRSARKDFQMIFQDPFSSLNPRMRIGSILEEPLIVHTNLSKKGRKAKVTQLIERVGLRPESALRYPHEFSGGQRQRIGIARALAVNPDFIVADEPVSALDLSIQAQVLNLLKELKNELDLTYFFISHDLNVIRYLCDRVIVMYLGRVMEVLSREQLADPLYPKHPYTLALLNSVPKKTPDEVRPPQLLKGDIPSPARPPSGCVFHTRCPEAIDICKTARPALVNQPPQSDHQIACHLRTKSA